MGKVSRRRVEQAENQAAEEALLRRAERRRREEADKAESKARARLQECAETEDGRVCPVCMDDDAVSDEGHILGLACESGHAICARCAGNLVYKCGRDCGCASGVSYKCPTCRTLCSVKLDVLVQLTNQLAKK
jgi:hypothetical protein